MASDPFHTSNLNPAERLVLAALAAEPGASVPRLETLTAMEPDAIRRALAGLRKKGLLEQAGWRPMKLSDHSDL